MRLSVIGPESSGPRQIPRVPPMTTVSSPAYSMSVIVIVLTALAVGVFLSIIILACRRRRRQWRNRKRYANKRQDAAVLIYLCIPHSLGFCAQGDGDPNTECSSIRAPAGSTTPQPHVPACSPAAELKAAGPRVSTE